MKSQPMNRAMCSSHSQQRGIVLLFTLIAMLIMMLGAVAVMRSFNVSLNTAGNIAFKRDMTGQSERAVDAVLAQFRAGGALSTFDARKTTTSSLNYSARILPSNAQGVPKVLGTSGFVDPDTSVTVGVVANDITVAGQAMTIRYVIDRQCATDGEEITLGATACRLASNNAPTGTSSANLQGADRISMCSTCVSAIPQSVIYRLSIRIDGPRGTQSFYQSTFTLPSTS